MSVTRTTNLLLGAVLLLGLLSSATAAAETVIVHPDTEARQLSSNALRAIMGMRLRTWRDGTPVRVFVFSDRHPSHQRFTKSVLGLFPHQLRRTWDRLAYSGIGQAPTQVSSPEEMRQLVASTPGAIGYLEEDMIDDSVRAIPVR